jgi:hypothetical protein
LGFFVWGFLLKNLFITIIINIFNIINIINIMSTFTTECKKDEDWNSKWGTGGKTATFKAYQKCSDLGYYDTKIVDCGGWK